MATDNMAIIAAVAAFPFILAVIWIRWLCVDHRRAVSVGLARHADCGIDAADRPILWEDYTAEGVHEVGDVDWAHIKVCDAPERLYRHLQQFSPRWAARTALYDCAGSRPGAYHGCGDCRDAFSSASARGEAGRR